MLVERYGAGRARRVGHRRGEESPSHVFLGGPEPALAYRDTPGRGPEVVGAEPGQGRVDVVDVEVDQGDAGVCDVAVERPVGDPVATPGLACRLVRGQP